MSGAHDTGKQAESRRTGWRLAFVALAMFGFGFALVPFYNQICQVLGVNNLAAAEPGAPRNTQVDTSRSVTVELDGNVHDLPWRLRPLEPQVVLHPGELAHAVYEVSNQRDRPLTAQAIPSYGPQIAGEYFHKLQCFCFQQQTLAPGETRKMPVVFTVDPALPKDIKTITLSYTFFEVEGTEGRR
jgi:cytochrome c oxidase assembly protein subunit 11